MDKVVQANAANAEESASASEEMSSQAEEMNAMVAELVNIVGGSSGGGQAVATASRRRTSVAAPSAGNAHLSGKAHGMLSAGSNKKAATVGAKPEEVIPLDDEEFKDF